MSEQGSSKKRLSDANLEYHAKSGTYDLASMAQELIERRAHETSERPMTLGRLMLETARGNAKERVLTPKEAREIGKQLVEIGEKAKAAVRAQFFPGPLNFIEPESDQDVLGPRIVDANGSLVASLYWPGHPAEQTEAAEQETYALGRAMATALDSPSDPETNDVERLRSIMRACPAHPSCIELADRPAVKANSPHKCKGCGAEGEPDSPDYCSADCLDNAMNGEESHGIR